MPKPQNKPKPTKQPRKELQAKAPPTPLETRQRFQQLQLMALARSLQPVEHPSYDLKSPVGVIEFSHWLIDARLERKIGVDDLVGMTRVCDMLLRYYSPSTVTVVQGNIGGLMFQGVKIERSSQVDEIIQQGGIAYAATVNAEPSDEAVHGSGG